MTVAYDPGVIHRLVREARELCDGFRFRVGEPSAAIDAHRHLRELADQLEAAKAELVNATDCWHACEKDNVKLACELQDVYRERNAMRPVVEAAEQWRSSGHGAAATLVLVSAIDAYRAAKDKT